jgi:hypothetical protein
MGSVRYTAQDLQRQLVFVDEPFGFDELKPLNPQTAVDKHVVRDRQFERRCDPTDRSDQAALFPGELEALLVGDRLAASKAIRSVYRVVRPAFFANDWHLARRKLGCVRLGRSVRVPASEITRLIEKGTITRLIEKGTITRLIEKGTIPPIWGPSSAHRVESPTHMSVFRRPGRKVWWFEFEYRGRRYRESAGTRSKPRAIDIERNRRREVEEAANGIRRNRDAAILFSAAAKEWLQCKRSTKAVFS